MQTKLTELTALSPLDGRYAEKTESLRLLFSEYALMRYRVLVEIRWLKFLRPTLSAHAKTVLENLYVHFSYDDAQHIKNIEKTTNHDVKAVEYYLKEKLAEHPELSKVTEWVHFGLTSEDINNLAYALMLQTAREQVLMPYFDELLQTLRRFAHEYADCAMLSRTHGQAATPTTMGKEFANITARLQHQLHSLVAIKIRGKINGAVGNFNAQHVAMPQKNWPEMAEEFVNSLGLSYELYTTQIEPHDYIAELSHNLMRIHVILTDFCRDMWAYISLGYFKQNVVASEVGSSTMPHKVNPIDFENAEGNLYLANALLHCLADKLPVSRFQRDLVDSTLLRNFGVCLGHAIVSYQALMRGLNKLQINPEKLSADLQNAWEVLAEPIQMTMRAHGIEQAYEKLKALTRGERNITQAQLHEIIEDSELPESIQKELKKLIPEKYTGYAASLAKKI